MQPTQVSAPGSVGAAYPGGMVLAEKTRALEELWADRGARNAWIRALVHAGAKRFGPGEWRIEHPPGWAEAERRLLAEEAARLAGRAPGFAADASLAAGLRLVAGGAMLDASPAALTADPGCRKSLLAELRLA